MKKLGLTFALWLAAGAAFAAEPLKVADVVELSGVGASNGNNWKNAVDLAVSEINAKGGVLGRPLAVTHYDTQTNPGVSRAQVQKALDDEPYALLGPIYSGSVKVNMMLAERAGVPQLVGAQAADLSATGNTSLFRTNLNQDDGIAKVARYLADTIKVKSVAMVWVNNDYGKGGRAAFMAEMKRLGIEYVAETSIENGQVDFVPDVLKMKNAKPDAVLVYLNTEESAKFVRESRRQGLETPLIGETTLLNQGVVELADPAANGIKGHISLSANAPGERVAAFRQAFRARYNAVPDHNAVAGYLAVYVLKAATEKVGKADSKVLAKAMHGMQLKAADDPGLLFDISFNERGDPDFDSLIGEVRDGEIVITSTVPRLRP